MTTVCSGVIPTVVKLDYAVLALPRGGVKPGSVVKVVEKAEKRQDPAS
jgi:hypothetical protein